MKRAIIVHRWGGNPEEGWFPWLKTALEARGFVVDVPVMPDTDCPTIAAWVGKLSEVVGTPNEELVLVGHSIGTQTILRYLATINATVGKAVLVAPWLALTNSDDDVDDKMIAKPWLETPIDFAAVKSHCKNIMLIFSDNDELVSMDNKEALESALEATSIVLHNKGHIGGEANVTELPEALAVIV